MFTQLVAGTWTPHMPLLEVGSGRCMFVCVCRRGVSQLGEQDREVDDSRVFYFPWHFQKVASDYTTSSHS